jgi:hypothetical protein
VEYQLSKLKWVPLVLTCSGGPIVVGVWMLGLGLSRNLPQVIFWEMMVGGSMVLLIFGFLSILSFRVYRTYRVRLSQDSIKVTLITGVSELRLEEIDFYEISDQSKLNPSRIEFFPKVGSGKKTISVSSFCEGYLPAIEWARVSGLRCPSPNDLQIEAKKVMNIANLLSLVAMFAFIAGIISQSHFFPFLVAGYLTLPWLLILFTSKYQGELQLWPRSFKSRETIRLSLFGGVLAYVFPLLLFSLGYAALAEPMEAIPPAGVVALAYGVLLWRSNSAFSRGSRVVLLIFSFFYGIAFTMTVNCLLDVNQGVPYQTRIVEKREESGRRGGKVYRFVIAPFGPVQSQSVIMVHKSWYTQKNVGDTYPVEVRPGKLGIAWFQK